MIVLVYCLRRGRLQNHLRVGTKSLTVLHPGAATDRMQHAIATLRCGLTEMYTHAAAERDPVHARMMPEYEHGAEFRARARGEREPAVERRKRPLRFQLKARVDSTQRSATRQAPQ